MLLISEDTLHAFDVVAVVLNVIIVANVNGLLETVFEVLTGMRSTSERVELRRINLAIIKALFTFIVVVDFNSLMHLLLVVLHASLIKLLFILIHHLIDSTGNGAIKLA